ncbi:MULTISPECIES: RagB/SusD family nutrient uptake outer membrane protein [Salegentibacter]|uniref:SusD family protein n=1 Tax=Salegentibacter agarivorans TaxID=345907 RepID=A0A1I2N6N9_9FLAO|nr:MULTISPECIES: RagB/SusD family nutrient uptake outer membrane protein [Salegentibacter]SFF97041.1 SusD family protein [Salegentibacter agarivorans]
MKNFKILYIASLITILTGCSDYLDEEINGALVGKSALNSEEGLEAALTGAYKGWGTTWGSGFLHSTSIAATMGADDVTTHKASNKASFREFDQFNVSETNQRTQALYTGCYKAIQGANNIIANFQNATGNQETITTIAGEAYFVRAVSYFWLVRLYGEIPLITQAEYSEDLLTIEKSSPEEVYALIEADLKLAEEKIPNTKRDAGRPNKGTVKAYLARVYLTAAGWPLKQTDKYALAAAKAKEVIDNKEIYGFELLSSLAEVFENDPEKNGTKETVFQISTFRGNGTTTNGNYGSAAMPGEESGWDDFFAELNFFNNFPEGVRKEITFRTEFITGDGEVIPWQESQTEHPYYEKYYIKGDERTWSSSVPESMMRYAHVLTIYAEAQARATGSPDVLAYESINAIRHRAGLEDLSGLTGSEFAAAVVQERAWEFAAERTRWFDLIRLEMVEEANANKHPDDLQTLGEITKEDYTFPLPFSDTSINENL